MISLNLNFWGQVSVSTSGESPGVDLMGRGGREGNSGLKEKSR